MSIYGYARVSSKEQNSARQIVALQQFGVSFDNIFIDDCSGKNFDCPAYRQILTLLRP